MRSRDPVHLPLARVFAAATGLFLAGCAASTLGPAIPAIEAQPGWQLTEGCRTLIYGLLSDPGCDILSGAEISIQVTRVRILKLPPGADDRGTVGVELRAVQEGWSFGAPYVALVVAGRTFTSTQPDETLDFGRQPQPVPMRRLPRDQQAFALPIGERMFFRFRFAVSQRELADGFTLQVTGLRRQGAAISVSVMTFKMASR